MGFRFSVSGFIATLGLALSAHAGKPPESDIPALEPLPGLFPLTAVHDLANSGEAVGRTWKEEGIGVQNHHAVRWSASGEPTDIGENGRWSEAYGISETGLIAGRHHRWIEQGGGLDRVFHREAGADEPLQFVAGLTHARNMARDDLKMFEKD